MQRRFFALSLLALILFGPFVLGVGEEPFNPLKDGKWPDIAVSKPDKWSPQPNTQEGPLAKDSPLWIETRAAAANKKLDKSEIHAGLWGKRLFEDVPPEGGVLIGFYYMPEKPEFPTFLQAIYLTANGERVGRHYGELKAKPACLKAKPGYAVGAITVRAGDLLNGIGVIFMKAEEKRLNPKDQYLSHWIGFPTGGLVKTHGDGRFITGIHGRLITEGGIVPNRSVATMGIQSLGKK